MRAADAIMTEIAERHRHSLGPEAYDRFLADFRSVVEQQRAVEWDALLVAEEP